jgi:tRNA-Thr(GGU) m(6)t(6)A37 methyltransferase TsaA
MPRVKEYVMRPIGHVRSPHIKHTDIPKGLGTKHVAEGEIVVEPEYEQGLVDIEGMSHLFIIWAFSESEGFSLLAQPPSSSRSHGVFVTRSPRRPNPIGLTVVQLIAREGNVLHVSGVDMLDGTPVLDIKPYLSSVPPEELRRGWLDEEEA